MAVRTIFNVLGPLTNPAKVKRQLVGVFAPDLTDKLANVFAKLGSEHTLVVHSDDGMDELSISAPTQVSEMKDGKVTSYKVSPEDFGLETAKLEDLVVADSAESLAMINAVFDCVKGEGEQSAARGAIALNAGAGIYVSGLADSIKEGVEKALETIDSGKAKAAFSAYVKATQEAA